MSEEVRRINPLQINPIGVDTPRNFKLTNYYRLYGLEEYAKREYEQVGQRIIKGETKPAWVTACQECSDCEQKCPQIIKIRKQLKETDTTLSI